MRNLFQGDVYVYVYVYVELFFLQGGISFPGGRVQGKGREK